MSVTPMKLVDLTICETEPIHIPGSIQSHGFLICVEPLSYRIVTVSGNVEFFLGRKPPALLGNSVLKCFGPEEAAILNQQLDLISRTTHFETQSPTGFITGQKNFDLIIHRSGDKLVLEFELREVVPVQIPIHQTMTAALNRIQSVASSGQLFVYVASLVREITGYDRVMAYKFHPDGHGEVIAEEKSPELPSFLNYHYPASDIPKQARELYKINFTRLIADIEEPVSKLIALPELKDQPLDLSQSTLRAVSPVHIEYLRNMGVRSSFSISLIYKKELWGLIACHNYSRKPPPDYNSRLACRLVGQLFSSSLESRIEEDNKKALAKYLQAEKIIQQELTRNTELPEVLINGSANLLSVNSAGGAVVFYNEKLSRIGNTPSDEQLAVLIGALHAANLPEIHSANSILPLLPEAHHFADTASGYLLLQISPGMKEFILWFKPEIIQTYNWAGDPEKPVTVSDDGSQRVSPRKSFDQWQRQMRYSSQDWTEAELQAATLLREHIIIALNSRARDIRTLNELLKSAYEELDTFTFTISHDLRTPLSSIRNYTELILDDYKNHLPAEAALILRKVVNRTEKMEQLIKDVLQYSKMNRTGIVMEKVPMGRLLADVSDQVRSSSSKGAAARIICTDPIDIYADPAMAEQLFANIIGNAVKYTAPGVVPQVEVNAKPYENGYILYSVKDNGTGFDMRDAENIFELFHRLDTTDGIDGTGIGLAIVKRIVERNKGKIWVESVPNQGTTFYICLLMHLPKNLP